MTNDKMRECGQACARCGKYLGMATGKLRLCKKCKILNKGRMMAENTTIEWATHTFNPWIGCTKISAACDNCYAANFGNRFGIEWGAGKPRKRTSKSTWKQPLRWNRQALLAQNEWFRLINKFGSEKRLFELGFVKPQRPRVFCASLADVFDNEVPDEWRDDLFDLIDQTPYLDWLILTKRIGNVENMMREVVGEGIGHPLGCFPHVWLGITICNQEEADRDIPKLLATQAAKRFVSIEPMLGAIDLTTIKHTASAGYFGDCLQWYHKPYGCDDKDYPNIDWVICGGESGKNARPMHPDWVRSLRDQCADAGVPFLFKQWGGWEIEKPKAGGDLGGDLRRDIVQHVCADRENDGHFRRGDVYMRRVSKKQAGRLLDGVLHNEFPRSEQ